ncbi:MAG TPA: hypothetical protein VGI60_03265 [Chthoniobacterales bacterium]
MTQLLLDGANLIGLGCWCVCFWWMHRISSRQDVVLAQLQKQSERIEKISREEHAILNELHPNVEAIQKEVGVVSEKVARVENNVGEQGFTTAP